VESVLWAAGGTGFTFFMTALGASMVFLFRKSMKLSVQRIFLGFAAVVVVYFIKSICPCCAGAC